MCSVEINVCTKCTSPKNLSWGGGGGNFKGVDRGVSN